MHKQLRFQEQENEQAPSAASSLKQLSNSKTEIIEKKATQTSQGSQKSKSSLGSGAKQWMQSLFKMKSGTKSTQW